MATQLKSKPGISGTTTLSIPEKWSASWFRSFIANQLKGADVRNAIGTGGITITGNISSPYATINGSGTTGPAGPPGTDASCIFQTRGATWVAAGGPIVPGNLADVSIIIPEDSTIIRSTVLTKGGTGSCSIDVWGIPIASYPATVTNSLVGGNFPAIAGGTFHDDITLTSWNTTLPAGQSLTFHLVSSSVFTEITIQLTLQRTGVTNITGYTDAQAIAATASALANTGNVHFTYSGGAISANYVATGTSHGANGYETLSSGLILQWGKATLTNGNNTVTFPLTFPTTFFNGGVTISGNNGIDFWEINDGTSGPAPTLSTMNIYVKGNCDVFWTAIGN